MDSLILDFGTIKLHWQSVLLSFLCAFFLSSIIAIVYERTFQGLSWSRGLMQSMVLGSIITCLLMIAIGDNVARGIGIVGSLAIVRFRTNLRDPRDLVFLFAALGAGDLRPGHVVNQSQSLLGDDPQQELAFVPARSKASESGDVTIQGVGNLLTHMAACCRPVPGDQVMGFITQGRGVTVHRADCHNLLAMQGEEPNRVIEVSWGEADRIFYPVDIFLRAWDRQGLLRDVIAVLANEKVNVTAVHTQSHQDDNTATMLLTLEIATLGNLGKVLAKMDQLKGVLEVRRYKK